MIPTARVKGLTLKQQRFCEEYIITADPADAYMKSYDCTSPKAASVEGNRLLKTTKIQDYLLELQKPAKIKAFKERDKKRNVLWSIIEDPESSNADICRAMDILNKLDGEYVNVNHNVEETATDISNLDLETLKQIAN